MAACRGESDLLRCTITALYQWAATEKRVNDTRGRVLYLVHCRPLTAQQRRKQREQLDSVSGNPEIGNLINAKVTALEIALRSMVSSLMNAEVIAHFLPLATALKAMVSFEWCYIIALGKQRSINF